MYNHYIIVDDNNCIIDGWSDGPCNKDTSTAICIAESESYHFAFLGEENPALFDMNGIPVYKYENGEVAPRTSEEIELDFISIPKPKSELDLLREQLADSQRQTTDLQLAFIELYEQLEVYKNGG